MDIKRPIIANVRSSCQNTNAVQSSGEDYKSDMRTRRQDFVLPEEIPLRFNTRKHSPVSVVEELNPGAGYLKLNGMTLPCSYPVTLYRKCGHKVEIECQKASGIRTQCGSQVTFKHPLCGHSGVVSCGIVKMIDDWNPWTPEFLSSPAGKLLISQGVYSETSPKPEKMPSMIINKLPNCTHSLIFKRACGHEVQTNCNAVFQGRTQFGHCQESVHKFMAFGHSRNFRCCQYQEYLKKPQLSPCSEKPEALLEFRRLFTSCTVKLHRFSRKLPRTNRMEVQKGPRVQNRSMRKGRTKGLPRLYYRRSGG